MCILVEADEQPLTPRASLEALTAHFAALDTGTVSMAEVHEDGDEPMPQEGMTRAFEEHVTVRDQRDQRLLHDLILADHDSTDLRRQRGEDIAECGAGNAHRLDIVEL